MGNRSCQLKKERETDRPAKICISHMSDFKNCIESFRYRTPLISYITRIPITNCNRFLRSFSLPLPPSLSLSIWCCRCCWCCIFRCVVASLSAKKGNKFCKSHHKINGFYWGFVRLLACLLQCKPYARLKILDGCERACVRARVCLWIVCLMASNWKFIAKWLF